MDLGRIAVGSVAWLVLWLLDGCMFICIVCFGVCCEGLFEAFSLCGKVWHILGIHTRVPQKVLLFGIGF